MHVIIQSAILFLWMQTLTFVRSEDCTLKQFLESNKYDENFDTSNLDASYPPGKQFRVSCNVGYTGFFKLICTERGWETRGTKCELKSCGHPGDAQFADFALVQGDDFVFGSRVVYTCQKGYQMVSRTSSRQCMAGGWDGVVPVCEAQQCPAIHVDGNVLVTGDPDEATFGNVVRFSCKSNTEMLEGPVEIYCDENGAWSAEAPKCKEITCEIPVIENGFVHDKKLKYNEKDVLHFTCNPSFKPAEVRPSTCAKFGSRAEWSPTPLCEPIKCRLSVALEGTSYDPAYRNVFSPGDTLRVNCGEKYWISQPEYNSAVTTCNPDGEWTIRPVCQEVRCSTRQPHVYRFSIYWGQIITMDETVGYSCRGGYKSPDGRNLATCTRKGWRPDPLCQEITCEPKRFPDADPEEPFKDQYSNYEKVRYTCKEGFTGQFTLTCRGSSWTGSPGCRAITCDPKRFPDADPEEYFKYQYSYNEEVRYICKDHNAGEFTLKCGKQGWIGSPQCAEPFKYQYSYNERVRYICKEGYDGEFTVTCRGSGWTGSQRCRAITCDPKRFSYADPEEDLKSQYSYNEEVRYICKDRNAGEFTLKCGKQGWIGSQQCAEPFKYQYSYNEEVRYICKEGYDGEFTLTCGGSGWIRSQRCRAITCIPPTLSDADPEGRLKSQYSYNEEVRYICKDRNAGEFTLKCGKQGWIGLQQCAEPFKYQYSYNEEVRYICKKGYDGEFTVTCGGSGWTESQRCRAITCIPPTLSDADPEEDFKSQYSYNEEVRYICKDRNAGEFTLKCGKQGWIGSQQCAETACTKPSISNGFVVGPINQTVFFACNEGYKLFTKGWWGAAKCDGTEWSVLDRCIAKSECGKTPVIANGEVAEETGQIKCNNGYQQEVDNLTCQDGKWTSGGIPLNAVCRSIGTHCKAPRRVENAVVLSAPMKEYLSDSSVTYQCHDNYTMVGENTILCKNGTWEQKSIHCTEITCDRKNYPNAAIAGPDKDKYENKEEAVYDCTYGGQFTLTCGKTGWTGSDECSEPTEDSDAGHVGRPEKIQ